MDRQRRLSKPKNCAACGNPEIFHSGRLICSDCERFIALGKQVEKSRKIQKGEKLIVLAIGEGFEYERQIYSHRDWDPELSEGSTRKIAELLARLLSKMDVANRWDDESTKATRMFDHERVANSENDWKFYAVLEKSKVPLVKELLAMIYGLIQSNKKEAYRRGHNLLLGLADGSYSVSEFNERTTEG